jgi:HSP20 family molecular chaperone IbpA
MTRLPAWGVDPFDLLWKNLFDQNSSFSTLGEKISYPVDIIETENGVVFELAVVGLGYEDIDIEVSNDVLRIKYSKANDGDQPLVN